VVPTLLTWRDSCIVYDLKEENFQRTAGERSRFSDILYFNPNSLNTTRFNPLLEIRRGDFEVRDAQNIANMIIEPDRPGAHDHWVRTGNSLLTAAILHVFHAAPDEDKNLAGVAALLSRPDKGLTETLQEMLNTKHLKDAAGRPSHPHPGVVSAVRDVLNKSGDDKSSVVSTVMGYLGLYRDPLLANATQVSDFSIDNLVNAQRPKSLYMVIPAGDIDRLRPVIRLMVNLICRRLTEQAVTGARRDQEHRHKLLLMLDEFPALGRLEFFESALGFLAGYGLKAMLVAQSLAQLKQVYGERTSILDNTHVRVFFRPETIETAEYISKTLGQTTITYKTRSEGGKKGSPWFSSINESMHHGSRPLLTPREVMELPDDEAFVLVGGGRPIRAKKIRYFDDGSFKPLLRKPTYPPPTTPLGRLKFSFSHKTANDISTLMAKEIGASSFREHQPPATDSPFTGMSQQQQQSSHPWETSPSSHHTDNSQGQSGKVVLLHPYRRLRDKDRQGETRSFTYHEDSKTEGVEELA
jgi:type IV secretion system protein VirD4